MSNLDSRSMTLRYLVDSKTAVHWQKYAFLEEIKRTGGIEQAPGSDQIDRIVVLDDPHVSTLLSTGYEALDLTTGDTSTDAKYTHTRIVHPIIVSNKALDENNGKLKVASVIEKRSDAAMIQFMKRINRHILVGDGSATYAQLNTLNGQAGITAINDGFLEPVARAAQVNTVGGINKAAVGEGWKNGFGDAGGSFLTDGRAAMDDVWTQVAAFGQSAGKKFIVSSLPAFRNYKSVLFAQERYIDQKSLDGGVMRLLYDGQPLALDPAMDFSAFGTEISMYFLDADAIKLVMLKNKFFEASKFIEHPSYDSQIAKLYWNGQLIADALAPCGVLINGDTP